MPRDDALLGPSSGWHEGRVRPRGDGKYAQSYDSTRIEPHAAHVLGVARVVDLYGRGGYPPPPFFCKC